MISPSETNVYVQKLFEKLAAEYDPEIVPIRMEEYSKIRNCYVNVDEKIRRNGGKAILGWAIWQGAHICEAEHHAVWEDEEGSLWDVTPQSTAISELMFLPDDRYSYNGRAINNVRINITGNPVVDHFIYANDILFFSEQYETRINDEEVAYPAIVLKYREHLGNIIYFLMAYLNDGGKMGTTCFCGSAKKYSACHGNEFYKNLDVLKNELEKEMRAMPK